MSGDPSPVNAAPITRKRLDPASRRSAIIERAAIAFAATGFAATSMADISEAAGVSHLIVYRHFSSKEQLYEAVIERAIEQLDAGLAIGGVGRFGPTPATMLSMARSDPAGFVVLWCHAAREPEFRSLHDRARERLVDLTVAAMRPRVAPRDRRWAARATVSYLTNATVAWLDDGDPRLDGRFVSATDAALRAGIRSWSATG